MANYYEGLVMGDLKLYTSTGNIGPAVCHFENNLGLVPYNTLVAAFNVGDSLKGDLRLEFNDRYSGNPMLNAAFNTDAISALPQLKF